MKCIYKQNKNVTNCQTEYLIDSNIEQYGNAGTISENHNDLQHVNTDKKKHRIRKRGERIWNRS